MVRHSSGFRFFFLLWMSASAATLSYSDAAAQATLKKIRLGIAATSVGFLPIYTAYHRGFYKDEGIDLEIILMSLAAANNAFFKGEIDYSAGLTGLALAAVRNYPAKILIFTVAKPLQSFVSRKEIKEPRDLRGKKVAGSSPGGSATILAYRALRHFGLEPGKDVTVTPMGGSGAGRLAVLESGLVDASLLSVPENIIAAQKGYHELIFLGDIVTFPQNGFGASVQRIQQQPDEVYRMVRATLRGLAVCHGRRHPRSSSGYYDEAVESERPEARRRNVEVSQARSRQGCRDQPRGRAVFRRPDPRDLKHHAAHQRRSSRRLQLFGPSAQGAAGGALI